MLQGCWAAMVTCSHDTQLIRCAHQAVQWLPHACACLRHVMHSAAQFGHFDATLQSVVLVTALPFFVAVTGFAAAVCSIETQCNWHCQTCYLLHTIYSGLPCRSYNPQSCKPLHKACPCYRHVMHGSTASTLWGTFQLDTRCVATLLDVVLVTAFPALPLFLLLWQALLLLLSVSLTHNTNDNHSPVYCYIW